uniref:C3a anaphylatoxin chemotactic receptor-like n=1 Tax=Sinocyclocheilus grahami TaxID=75366 RepID=A0A672T5B7_SINGR
TSTSSTSTILSNITLLLHTHYELSNTTADIEAIMNKVSIVFLNVIVLLGTTGNSVVIWVAGFLMKPNVTNVWLVNLAVADLIFFFLCKFNGFFKYANMFCSVFLLAVISGDRALCVWCPVFTRERRTLCAARVVSVGVWIVAVIFSSPYFVYLQVYLGKNNLSQCDNSSKYVYYCIRFICGFLLPFLVILICYIAAVGIHRTRLSGKSRHLRILAVLVCAFFLCWAPYHFLGLVKLVNKDNEAVKVALSMASKWAYFNSCINTVLYFCMGLDVRRHCNQSLSGIFHRVLMEEGQSLSRQGNGEESAIPKTADTECVTVV